ncbi:MAG TPA: glycosyltransferase family 2 protein [Anaerolineales bacterium]
MEQDYPPRYMEILVADGMSDDDTRKKILSLARSDHHALVVILDNPAKIVPTGMNIALRQARGEIIIRVDGHCMIDRDYVSKCVEHIQMDGVDGVGGPMESLGTTRIAKIIAIGMSSLFGVGNSVFRTVTGKSMLVDTVPFPAYTRQIIDRAGGYDEELVRNQDDEYNYRIRELGGKILLAIDVRSKYFSRTSLAGLWGQYFQYGFWKVRVLQKHPLQMSSRQFVPPVFVLALLLSALLALLPLSRPYASIVPFSYLIANLGAAFWIASRRRWASLPLLPIIFAILHLSYGLGFLVGMVKFSGRWNDKLGKVPTL